MSVKDKIAMWNNLKANSNPPPKANLTKALDNDIAKKSKETQNQKKIEKQSQNSQQKLTSSIEPPNILKKPNSETQNVVKTQSNIKPLTSSEKPKQSIPKAQQKKVITNAGQQNGLGKIANIKKLLEGQIGAKGLFQAPPAPVVAIKKVESQVQQEAEQKKGYEIEKNIPTLSVKQQAAKLALFFAQKQKEGQLKSHHQPQKIAQSQKQKSERTKQGEVQLSGNTLNIQGFSKQEKIKEQEVKQQKQIEANNIQLRFTNKNKKKKQAFDDDD